MSAVASPFVLGPLALRNRTVKTATYEGMVVDGMPAETLVRHHREIAAGGAGMTTVAYCAVSERGRTFEAQLVMRDEAMRSFRALTDAVHAEGAAASLQLGHAGGFTKDASRKSHGGPRGPSPGWNAYGLMKGMPRIAAMDEDDMARTARDFASAASRARDAGFDAVELHFGHGYLLSQFLSPFLNRRRDAYGGSTENRMRFPLRVLDAVRAALGPTFPVLCKTNLEDGVRGGLAIEESVTIARALEDRGASALVLSGGLVSHSAFHLLRGERPLGSMVEVEEDRAMKVALRVFGPIFVPRVPFAPLFFLDRAREVRRAVRLPLVYLGGVTSLDDAETAMREGFELVAIGRALLSDPDLPSRWARGERARTRCIPCNECIAEMDREGGVLCARRPEQVARRAREVEAGMHATRAGART
jgi:2,4-dienoyl-CoA reductase-like NADH-dependent reductase (Old Yellow Enzyme family)